MSLEHSPARRSSKRKPQHHSALDAPLPLTSLHDNQILTFFEWCQLNRVSARTGRRIIKGPDGPIVTRLSSKRIGVSVINNRNWQQSRARG